MDLKSKLSNFDSDETAFFSLQNKGNAKPNYRKRFVVDMGLMNKLGIVEDDFHVNNAGEVLVAGENLKDINREFDRQDLGKMTGVPTGPFVSSLDSGLDELNDTGLRLINPDAVYHTLGDKAHQYKTFYDEPGITPPFQPLGPFMEEGGDLQEATAILEDEFVMEGEDEAPILLKVRDGSKGDDIYPLPGGFRELRDHWEDLDEDEANAVQEEAKSFILSYSIPHFKDQRVYSLGNEIVFAEDRFPSEDDDKCNLSQKLQDREFEGYSEKARVMREHDYVDAIKPQDVDLAVERAVNDHYQILKSMSDLDEKDFHTAIGWDMMITDPDDERWEQVPNWVEEEVLSDRYRTEDGNYVIFGEGNLSPGSLERHVNAQENGMGAVQYDSALNLASYGESISKGEDFEVGAPEDFDIERWRSEYGF